MTEAAKVFNDDIREKKSIKNSANKKNRTGKGPVKFPSDYLSKKEKEKLNGECSTWKYSDFPDREAFNRMPDDIKIGYLNWIINVYGVGIASISKYVFNQADSALDMWFKNHNEVSMYVNRPKKGFYAKRKDIARLKADVEKARAPKLVEPNELTEEEQDYISGYEGSNESKDFTEEEKKFITTYLAPISEPKKVEDTMINPDDTDDSDISPTHMIYAFDSAVLPKMSSMEFSMDGFDMDFLRMIRDRFGDQKVHVCVSVYVEKDMYGDRHE